MTTNELLMIALSAAGFVLMAFGARWWIDRPAKPDPLADCIDVPRSTVKSRVPPLAAAQTRIYSYSACALAQNYHTSPAAVQALIDDAAAALNCGQPAAAVFVRRALRDYGSCERAAYWLRVEFEYMRLLAQKESSGE